MTERRESEMVMIIEGCAGKSDVRYDYLTKDAQNFVVYFPVLDR